MKGSVAIARRELLSYFVSPVAYIGIGGFLLMAGYFFISYFQMFQVYMARAAQMPMQAQQLNLNDFVIEGYFQTLLILLVFILPMLTMKLIADERKNGTFELLITSPLSVTDVVIGKFVGVGVVVLLMVVCATTFPLILALFGDPEIKPIFSGAFAVFLAGLGFASIGMAISAFTDNQVVAAIVTLVVLLVFYAIDAAGESFGPLVQTVLKTISPVEQARAMIEGVIETKSLAYFVLLSFFGSFLSCKALEAFRWR
jgi:ABC-2 type transport system permease protein